MTQPNKHQENPYNSQTEYHKEIESLLNKAVKRSLDVDPPDVAPISIAPCAKNKYLDPNFDPFEDLKQRLMLKALMEKHNITQEDLDGVDLEL